MYTSERKGTACAPEFLLPCPQPLNLAFFKALFFQEVFHPHTTPNPILAVTNWGLGTVLPISSPGPQADLPLEPGEGGMKTASCCGGWAGRPLWTISESLTAKVTPALEGILIGAGEVMFGDKEPWYY